MYVRKEQVVWPVITLAFSSNAAGPEQAEEHQEKSTRHRGSEQRPLDIGPVAWRAHSIADPPPASVERT